MTLPGAFQPINCMTKSPRRGLWENGEKESFPGGEGPVPQRQAQEKGGAARQKGAGPRKPFSGKPQHKSAASPNGVRGAVSYYMLWKNALRCTTCWISLTSLIIFPDPRHQQEQTPVNARTGKQPRVERTGKTMSTIDSVIPSNGIESHAHALQLGEAAKWLNCSKRFLENQVAEGKLPVVRLSPRCIRVRPSDLAEYLESHLA
jgi:excisionase family DNA binding protein